MNPDKHKIVCFHLLNDFSGSPKALRVVLQGLLDAGYDVDLYSSSGTGVLNKLASSRGRLEFYRHRYAYSRNKALTLIRFAAVQIHLFFRGLRYGKKDNAVFYINTILPFGAALAGKLRGVKVVYHYHENAFAKSRAYRLLAKLMQKCADRIICVSEYQRSFLKRQEGITVVPNVLSRSLRMSLKPHLEEAFAGKEVLMLSSLKAYKGTGTFVKLSALLSEFRFVLVINDTPHHIGHYLKSFSLPDNLTVYPRQNKVAGFYNEASLVVNLSEKSMFVETFGLTALEAMTAGLPVIVPTVGGIAEMVENGVNGYKIDAADLDLLAGTIRNVLTDRELYMRLSRSALECSGKYRYDAMMEAIAKVLNFSYLCI